MTPGEAAHRLEFHTQPVPGSFLGMLRPYQSLDPAVLDDLLATLHACADAFGLDPMPRALVSAVWTISCFGRAWALAPDGALRRNGLLAEEDRQRIEACLDEFDWKIAMLLNDGQAIDRAMRDDGARGD